jgi:hypothetical protein
MIVAAYMCHLLASLALTCSLFAERKSFRAERENWTSHGRFEVSAAVTVKNAVLWDINSQFVPHRRHHVSATELNRLMLCGETVAV